MPNLQSISAEFLAWIVCPACRQTLALASDSLRCTGCGNSYPVVDGIPVLLVDRAAKAATGK